MVSVPPPGGSRNACAQAPDGDRMAVSPWPSTAADHPPAGSASSRVPPAAGTRAPATPTGPEGIATTVPFRSMTLTRDGALASFHRSKADVEVLAHSAEHMLT
jgi:hypothetical protein